ncbi:MAG: DUF4870 domain-containing protein [Planctomycetes bacterium]|nr:DUF4870 domain-containing protein [Planctomycetota bacterium]
MTQFDNPNGTASPGQAGPGADESTGAVPQDLPTFMWKPREDQFTGEMKPDDKTMGMLCHLLGIFTFIGPLIIWLVKKDESRYVDVHGKEALNFQLSLFIFLAGVGVVETVLAVIPFINCLALVLMPALGLIPLFGLVMLVIASIKASEGKVFRYPLAIRLIR